MPSIRTLALAVLLACAAPVALAQIAQPAIEKQMTPEEFKAAGLDKLNADELARLNTWLGRTIETETAKVAADTKQKIEHENRGFFDFGSQEPITGRIAGEPSVFSVKCSHGGVMRVESAPGQGARFHLYIPLEGPAIEQAEPFDADSLLGEAERVLVVVEEAGQLSLLVDMLDGYG